MTKSGTNEFHGSGFWFVRNSALNARSYFLHQSDLLKRNQAGFTFGGPVVKNKLFFFVGLQQTWNRTAPAESKTLTMSGPFRLGDFSSLLNQSKPIVIIDPLSAQAFPNNQIPASRRSPAAQNLLKYSPLPGPDGFSRWVVSTREDLREPVFRVDYRPNQRHSILGRYYQNTDENDRTFDPNNLHTVANVQSVYTKNGTIGHIFVASSHLIADTHASVARTFGKRTNGFPKTIADFGVNVQPSSNQISVSINGTSGLSLSTVNPPARFARTNIELTHSWRWNKGRHNVIWGVDLMTSRYNEYNLFLGSGSFSFSGRYTGFDQADYILGLLNQFEQSNGEIEFRRYHYQGFYGGDSFRISRRLTLTYGLRWEPYTPLTDLNDRQVQFRQDDYLKGIRSARYVNAPSGLYYPGDIVSGYTIPKTGVQASKKQFAPRVGMAWDVTGDGKTSLRLGYGFFYDSPMLYVLNNMNVQTPFSFTVTFRDGVFDDPFRGRENLNVFPFSGDFDTKSPFQVPTSAVVYEPVWRQPYTQDWNLTLERSLGSSWLVQLSYVGTKGTNLDGNRDLNAPIYDYSKTLAQNRSTVNKRRPRPEFQDLVSIFTGLNSIYNSFQAGLNKRFSRGFTVLAAYTWSRAIDYQSANKEVTTQRVQNPFNIRMTRGPSDYDRTHRFTSSFVWNLPRAGKALHSGWIGAVTDNWQFSGIVGLTTGSPFGLNSTNDQMAGAGTARADLAGNLFLASDRSRGERIAQYFNTSAAMQAQPGSYGNLGRNVLRNPSGSSTDVSLSRAVPLKFRESASLTFRAEFFSLFNHPQLAGPDNRLGRSTFGQILNVGGQRVLQFGLKLGF